MNAEQLMMNQKPTASVGKVDRAIVTTESTMSTIAVTAKANRLPLLKCNEDRMNVEHADPFQSCTDEELLAQFQGGRQEAFAALVHRYEGELYGYLCRYIGDNVLAEDVFQNTFVQLFAKIDSYDRTRPARPWLYTIATHQAIDAMRRAGRHQAVSLDQQREEGGGEVQTLLNLLESQWAGPVEFAQTEERRLWVRKSVDSLPEFLKQTVVLAYYQGLKYREVAEILNVPLGTVKSRLHAALARLHEAWSAEEHIEE